MKHALQDFVCLKCGSHQQWQFDKETMRGQVLSVCFDWPCLKAFDGISPLFRNHCEPLPPLKLRHKGSSNLLRLRQGKCHVSLHPNHLRASFLLERKRQEKATFPSLHRSTPQGISYIVDKGATLCPVGTSQTRSTLSSWHFTEWHYASCGVLDSS